MYTTEQERRTGRGVLTHPDKQPITARLAAAGSLRTEVEALLDAVPEDASPTELRDLVIDANITGKASAAARVKTWTNLKARYVLDPAVPEYRAFVAAMGATSSPDEHGLLCLLMLARTDRLFREVTLECISPQLARPGTVIDAAAVQEVIAAQAAASRAKWTASTIETARQHLLSALKDCSMLRGSIIKRTLAVRPGTAAVLLAARLARLEGLTDRQVLAACWFRLLGVDSDQAVNLLYRAAQQGALGFRLQADIVELSLPPLEVPSDAPVH